jgi:hypothetical protein
MPLVVLQRLPVRLSYARFLFCLHVLGKKAVNLKRQLRQPRAGATISMKKSHLETVAPMKYEFLA